MARRNGRCGRGGWRKPAASVILFQVLQVDARRFHHLALNMDSFQIQVLQIRRRKDLGMEVRGRGRAWGWRWGCGRQRRKGLGLEVGCGVGEWGRQAGSIDGENTWLT
jgi:hypothetical protein